MRRSLWLALTSTLWLAACSDHPVAIDVVPGFAVATSADSAGGPPVPHTFFAAAGVTLQDGDGFEVTLASLECAAQGNRFSLTTPVSQTLTSSGCQEAVGRTWTFLGPYPAGTNVGFDFFSGFTNSAGQIRVSGAYPNWRVACEDGFDSDFNDLVFAIRALGTQGCPARPFLADPGFRDALAVLWISRSRTHP